MDLFSLKQIYRSSDAYVTLSLRHVQGLEELVQYSMCFIELVNYILETQSKENLPSIFRKE